MFADDRILFGKATVQQITCITKVPRNFCEASSQRVSVDKSRILFSKNTPMHIRNQIVQVYGLKETKELDIYLGVPLTRLYLRLKHYQYLIDKVRAKLTSWKGKQLSYAGRVNFSKTVMKVIPTYTMMSNKVHITCLKKIHKI